MINGSPRYLAAMASIEYLGSHHPLDLTEEDYNFVTAPRMWLASERARARRSIEAIVYGPLDILGLPRFSPPAEFVAAAIAKFVAPVNTQFACYLMEGFASIGDHIDDQQQPLRANQLFAHVLMIRAGMEQAVDNAQITAERKIKRGAMTTGAANG